MPNTWVRVEEQTMGGSEHISIAFRMRQDCLTQGLPVPGVVGREAASEDHVEFPHAEPQ